jgi:cell division transport system ATP-binding protein
MIEFHQVSKRYPNGTEAISQLNLKIAQGELVFITGHSGAGKSTLLRLLALLERPTRGRIIVGGKDLYKLTAKQIPAYRQGIGVITQHPLLLPDRSVFENVAMPLLVRGYSTTEVRPRVRAALARVGLPHKEAALPATLSCGEQQRVGIARAIVHRPALVLADEPTGNLDPALAFDMMSLFERFQQVGVTLVIASHDISTLAKFKHRTLFLEEGRLGQVAYA